MDSILNRRLCPLIPRNCFRRTTAEKARLQLPLVRMQMTRIRPPSSRAAARVSSMVEATLATMQWWSLRRSQTRWCAKASRALTKSLSLPRLYLFCSRHRTIPTKTVIISRKRLHFWTKSKGSRTSLMMSLAARKPSNWKAKLRRLRPKRRVI